MRKTPEGFYMFTRFGNIDGLIHGFSTRKFGSMKLEQKKTIASIRPFLEALRMGERSVVGMNQVHGDGVAWVGRNESFSIVEKVDGLVTADKGVFLYATIADCLPVLFYDAKKKIIGIAHVGWRGLLRGIIQSIIQTFVEKGSRSQDILIGIGPSIRACCYVIDREREAAFSKTFPKWSERILRSNKNVFLDMQELVKLQLIELGVSIVNIEDTKVCTKDASSEFYSFRRNDAEQFAAIIGIL